MCVTGTGTASDRRALEDQPHRGDDRDEQHQERQERPSAVARATAAAVKCRQPAFSPAMNPLSEWLGRAGSELSPVRSRWIVAAEVCAASARCWASKRLKIGLAL